MNRELVPVPRPVPRALLFGLVLLAAVLLPLALPNELFPYGNAALGPVCIAPVFVAVSLAPTFGAASLLGVVFGALSTALANYWLMFFQNFSIWTYGGVIVGYIGYNALLFPFLRGFARAARGFRPIALAMAWALYEYLKSIGFLAYPWGLVAYPLGDFLPLAQFIDATGIWGLSFLAAFVNALVAEWALVAFRRAPPAGLATPWPAALGRQAVFAGVLVISALAYGSWRLAGSPRAERTANLLLVQQNIDPWDYGKARADSTRINQDLTLEGLAAAPFRVDLVAWSETSVTDTLVVNGNRFRPAGTGLVPFARKAGVPLLFGGIVALDIEKQSYMNSAILMTPDGTIVDTYGKMHPVPFAEAIPFFEHEAVRRFFSEVVGIWNTWTMGGRRTIFRVPIASGGTVAFGAPICFEDAFSDLCRRFILDGADLWVNLTNDYWSKTVSSEYQHFQVARFRAIENRRPLVRSTNGGVTAVVDPAGRLIGSLPLFERGHLAVGVPLPSPELTPYTLLGDWFPLVLAAILLALLVADVALGSRKKQGARV